MNAWRSPLLYIGIALILIAAVAAAVPPFVDWNSYRADIEDYGKRLTGRDVKIAGDVGARLFPWPALWLDDVRVANPAGATFPELMRTGQVSIGLSLAPLISGRLVVESIHIDEPVFALERLASGSGTWALDPVIDVGQSMDVSRISVAGINISNGTVILADGRRGGAANLSDFDAVLSAPGLDGPWRLRGMASYGGQRTAIGISTGKLRRDGPVRFSINLRPHEGAGLSYLFDGVTDGESGVKGKLKVRPARAADGKGDAELDLRPLSLRADVVASFDALQLNKIEIAPDAAADAGNLVTGAAQIGLGAQISVDAQLKAAKLDIDSMMGARARNALYSGELLAMLSAALPQLPGQFSSNFSFAVTSLVFGGETVDGFAIAGEAARNKLKISRLVASMPGQTSGTISGLFVPDEQAPQFSGQLSMESVSLRDFIVWALPDQAGDINKVWSGARGKLDLNGKIDITPQRMRLDAERFVLDDATGNGSITMTGGDNPGLAIRLVADSINLDRYAPNGLTVGAVDTGGTAGLVDLVGAAMSRGDLQLTIQADDLVLHGVVANDIAIDAGADETGVELRTVEIGDVGAARVDIAGLLNFPGTGVSGALKADIEAADARGLLRLVGAIPRDPRAEPAWARNLGKVEVNLQTQASTDKGVSQGSAELKGTVGPSRVDLTGRFTGSPTDWENGTLTIYGKVSGNSAARLAALADVAVIGADLEAYSAAIEARGTPGRGMNTKISLEALGTAVQFAGRLGVGKDSGFFADGRLAVLAERAQKLYRAFGLRPVVLSPAAQILSAEGAFELKHGQADYRGVNGTASGTSFTGEAKLTLPENGRPTVAVTASTGRLDVGWLLGQALFGSDARQVDAQSSFDPSTTLPVDLRADLQVKQLEVLTGVRLAGGAVKFSDDGKIIDLSVAGGLGEGKKAEASLKLTRRSFDVSAEGRMSAQLQLENFLRTQSGGRALAGPATIELSVAGAGRSPAGILSTLGGSGHYTLGAGALGGVNVPAFATGLVKLKNAKAFDELVASRFGQGDLVIAGGSGKLTVDAGVLKASDLPVDAAGVSGKLRMLADLPSGEIDISSLLEMDVIEGLPPFEIAYAGPPGALSVSRDLAALKSFVGVNVLLKGMDRLEELQREQERIFRQESRFDRRQVLQQLEDAARKRREEAEKARREAEAERLRVEVEARERAEAKARRLAGELEEQKRRADEQRRLDELTREIAEEEAKRELEAAASRTRLEKHIRRAERPTNTLNPAPLSQAKPPTNQEVIVNSLDNAPVAGEEVPSAAATPEAALPTPIVPQPPKPSGYKPLIDMR